MYLRSIVGALALSTCALAKVIIVKVAPGGQLVFSPNTIMANKGDQIQFEFEVDGHSVVQGDFHNACQPEAAADVWFSGFVESGAPKPWTITLNESDPYPFYCAVPGHCQAGMVGVINPSGGDETLAAYKAAAGKSSSSKAPAKVQGGVFKAASAASASSSAPASSSSSAAPKATNAAGKMLMDSVAGTIPLGVVAYVLL